MKLRDPYASSVCASIRSETGPGLSPSVLQRVPRLGWCTRVAASSVDVGGAGGFRHPVSNERDYCVPARDRHISPDAE